MRCVSLIQPGSPSSNSARKLTGCNGRFRVLKSRSPRSNSISSFFLLNKFWNSISAACNRIPQWMADEEDEPIVKTLRFRGGRRPSQNEANECKVHIIPLRRGRSMFFRPDWNGGTGARLIERKAVQEAQQSTDDGQGRGGGLRRMLDGHFRRRTIGGDEEKEQEATKRRRYGEQQWHSQPQDH